MNSPEIQRQLSSPKGRARRLVESKRPPGEIVEELFLAAYARYPTAEEKAAALQVFGNENRLEATEDVLWSLMNTLEFAFVH